MSLVSSDRIVDTTFRWSSFAHQVFISGSFQIEGHDDWSPIPMAKIVGEDRFEITLGLKPGEYQYKFVVDGDWVCDPSSETVRDPSGNLNHIVRISAPVTSSER